MSTHIVRLNHEFTGPGAAELPRFVVDPIISDGTLALIEPAVNWPAGVPAEGSTVPNLASRNLRRLGISGGDAFMWRLDPEADNGTTGKIERSAKGGVHVIQSQATPIAAGKGGGLVFPTALVQHVIDNPTHTYAWSLWTKSTRIYGGQYSYVFTIMGDGTTQGGIHSTPWLGYGTGGAVANRRTVMGPLTPVNATAAKMLAREKDRFAFGFGRRATGVEALTNLPSAVFYRLTLEDLTLSGRSSAEFLSADLALHSAAFGSGGRYAGDTHTDPATLA